MGAALPASSGTLTIPSTSGNARRELVEVMRQVCRDMKADRYMLVDLSGRAGERTRIVASNWVFDAIDLIGLDLIARLAGSARLGDAIAASAAEQELLAENGHAEVLGVPLRSGSKRYALLLSAEKAGNLIMRARHKVELVCSYALSMFAGRLDAASASDPLSDRERECLFWVSEGKTTEEVGVILGVSTSTANSHLTNAMQKLGARNRSLAIATAIRFGLI